MKNEKGQVLIEFVLCLIILASFIFGIIGVMTWGVASHFAQEVAHESARKYAVTYNKAEAEKLGETYLKRWAYIFIDTSQVNVTVKAQGTKAMSIKPSGFELGMTNTDHPFVVRVEKLSDNICKTEPARFTSSIPS